MNRRTFLSLLPSIPLVPRLLGEDIPPPEVRIMNQPLFTEDWLPVNFRDGVRYYDVYCDGDKWHPSRPNYVVFDDLDELIPVRR